MYRLSLCCLSTLLFLTLAWPVPALADRVQAYACPAFSPHSPVDHTYLQAADGSGRRFSCKCLGGDQNGHLLPQAGVWGPDLPLARVNFMCNDKPCAWPKYLYASVGICHQLANRGLYSVEKEVSQARGYGLSFFFFGVYGRSTTLTMSYNMGECLRAAPAATRVPARNQATLYRRMVAKAAQPAQRPAAIPHDWQRDWAYHLASLRLRLDQTLGWARNPKQEQEIITLWQSNQEKLVALEKKHLAKAMMRKVISPAYIKDMDELAAQVQIRLRRLLTPEQYQRFLNLLYFSGEDNLVTWQDFGGPFAAPGALGGAQ